MYKTTVISLLLVLLIRLHYSAAEELEPDCPDEGPCQRQGFFVPNVFVPSPPPTQAPATNSLFSIETLLFLRVLGIDISTLLRRLLGRDDDDFDHEDEGWYEASNKCFYKFFTERVTYVQARDKCEDKDARLASSKGIHDADVRRELVLTSFEFPNNFGDVWVGLDALITQDVFVWSDGVTISNDDNLFPGIGPPPSTGSGDCVVLFSTDAIEGQDCGLQEYYLCEHCP